MALAAGILLIITFLSRASFMFLFIGVGLVGSVFGLIARFHRFIAALFGEPLPVRTDLQAAGKSLHDLSHQVRLERRIDEELGIRLERAADITLSALDRLPSLAATDPKLAREIELGLHEAMHEVITIVSPFVRPKGVGKTRHATQIGHLDLKQALDGVSILIVKLDAVNQTMAGPETRELMLDQTLNRLMELKRAEEELDRSVHG